MKRRSLLIGAGAALVGPSVSFRPGRAAPPTAGHKGCWAVNFDGATRLQNDGTIAGFPASSPYGMVSYLTNSTPNSATQNQLVIGQATSGNRQNFIVYHLTGGTKSRPTAAIVAMFGTGSGPGQVGHVTASSGNQVVMPLDGNYHLVQIAWDLTVPSAVMTLDRVRLPSSVGYQSPGPIQFNNWGGTSMTWYVGGGIFTTGGGWYKGKLAELFMFVGQQIDITSQTVQAAFWDSTTGKPTRPASNGMTPLGIKPNIYLSGPKSLFPANLPPRNFDWTSAADTGPSTFYTAAGLLQTADVDPWRFAGV